MVVLGRPANSTASGTAGLYKLWLMAESGTMGAGRCCFQRQASIVRALPAVLVSLAWSGTRFGWGVMLKRACSMTLLIALILVPVCGRAQALGELLAKTRCALPIYFPVETSYAGRLLLDHNRIKIQVNDFGSRVARDAFMKKNRAGKDDAFAKTESIHEFSTSGKAEFGSLPSDVYRGLEKTGDRYFFKVRGSGESLKQVKVQYRFVPAHGQVVIQEVAVLDYFSRISKAAIIPAIQSCPK